MPPRRGRGHARRPVRAFALDRPAGPGLAAVPLAAAAADALRRVLDEADAEAGLALIRAHPELAGRAMRDNSGRIHPRAGQGRPDPLLARGTGAAAAAQRRLSGPLRLSLHPGRARSARHRPDARRSSPTFERRLDNPPDVRIPRGAAQHPPHRRDPPGRRQFGLDLTLGNDIWDWHERLSVHSDPGYAEQGQLTVTYLTDAHRACAQRISHWMRDCGFDEVEIDAWATWSAATAPSGPTPPR